MFADSYKIEALNCKRVSYRTFSPIIPLQSGSIFHNQLTELWKTLASKTFFPSASAFRMRTTSATMTARQMSSRTPSVAPSAAMSTTPKAPGATTAGTKSH